MRGAGANAYEERRKKKAHGYDSMKNDTVVVSLFCEFCKVFACLWV